jgi:hypothetical protein
VRCDVEEERALHVGARRLHSGGGNALAGTQRLLLDQAIGLAIA